MRKIFSMMDRLFASFTFFSMLLIILVVLLQVVTRFSAIKSPVWTEELSRLLFISAVGFAAPIAMKRGEFVRVDTLTNLFPKKVEKLLQLVMDIVVFAFVMLVAYYAIDFVKLGGIQKSPSLGIKMSLPFSSMFVAPFFIGVYGLKRIMETARDLIKAHGEE